MACRCCFGIARKALPRPFRPVTEMLGSSPAGSRRHQDLNIPSNRAVQADRKATSERRAFRNISLQITELLNTPGVINIRNGVTNKKRKGPDSLALCPPKRHKHSGSTRDAHAESVWHQPSSVQDGNAKDGALLELERTVAIQQRRALAMNPDHYEKPIWVAKLCHQKFCSPSLE